MGIQLPADLIAERAVAVSDGARHAEACGVHRLWFTNPPTGADALTLIAAGLVATERIGFGSSVVPTYPRHPLVLAGQASSLEQLAPGRVAVGIGSSHRPIIEDMYGIDLVEPHAYLREYTEVLRTVLRGGRVDHDGRFFHVHLSAPPTPGTSIMLAALRRNAFELAGEVADGAISWMCPISYLQSVAVGALRDGADRAGRDDRPPLVAHVPVALGTDTAAARMAALDRVSSYCALPFYAAMFRAAGFDPDDATGREAIADELVITGDEKEVAERLAEVPLEAGDEMLVTPLGVTDPAVEWRRTAEIVGELATS